MKTNVLLKKWKAFWARTTLIGVFFLTGLMGFGHGVQLRWNIVPSTGAIRVWVEHWHGDVQGTSYTTFPLNVTYTVGGVTTSQTYYAQGYSNNTYVSNLPGGGNNSTLLSYCSGDANSYHDWVYWDFNPPACNTPVALTILNGPSYLTAAGCGTLYNKTIYSNFNDNTGPAITANDITVPPSGANCSAVVSNFGVTAVDACGGSSTLAYSHPQGTVFPSGTTAVTVTATDNLNNVSTSTFNVIVADNQAPAVLTQGLTVPLVAGTASITASQIDNGSYDNVCGGIANYEVSPSSFGCSEVGSNTVTLTVTDVYGNVGTGTAVVNVTSDLAVSATTSDVNCYGSCDGSVALSITGGHAPYSIVSGELDHSFDGMSIDNSLFTYSGGFSQNGALSTDVGSNTYWNNYFRTSQILDRTPGKTFEFKYYPTNNNYNMMGWYGTNTAHNASNQYANLVHALYFSGGSLHVYEDGYYYNLTTSFSYTSYTWYDCKIELKANGADYYIKASSSSNYTLVFSSNSSSETNLSPGMTPYDYYNYNGADLTDDWLVGAGANADTANLCAGNHTLTVMDASGCTADVTFTINEPSAALTSSIVQADSACMDENFSISAGNTFGGTAPYSYSWDMGDGSVVTGATANHVYTTLGAKNITLVVSDANGCSATYTSSSFVEQCNVPPVAVCQNITVFTDANCQSVVSANAIDGGSTDANGDVISFTMSPSGPFSVGVYNVTLTASDPMGASSQCVATITVEDNVNPIAVAQNVTVQLDASGNGSTTATLVDNGSSDACGIASMTIDNANFTCANVGSNNPVILTVTDVNGNVSTASAMVTVEDNVNPLAVAQGMTVQLDVNGSASITAGDIDNGSSDACGIASMILDQSNFDCSHVGSNSVTLTVTDNNGNSSASSVIVVVEDNVAPMAICQAVTVTLANGSASVTPVMVDNGSNDACGIASMTLSEDTWTCGDIGDHTVTLTVTDNNGNVSSCDAVVSVVGQIPTCSIASLPTNNTYTGGVSTTLYLGYGAQSTTLSCTATGGNSFTYVWTGTGLSSTTTANPVFTPTAEGIYNFSVVVTNDNGCETSCAITICVRDIRVYKKGKVQKNKVYLCHAPPGNPNNTQTLSVSVNAVGSHLSNHSGDALGTCGSSCGDLSIASKTGPIGDLYSEEFNGQDVDVILYPNPSTDFFSVMVESDMDDLITVELYDMAGNLVERVNGQLTYHQIEMGRDLASGMYMVVVTQGEYRRVIKASRTK